MKGWLGKQANLIRQSGMVLVIWLVAIGITAIGTIYFVDDYMTSVRGYQMVPTRHHFPWVVWVGAAMPQLGQIFFGYLALDEKSRWWSWIVVVVLVLVDSGTDMIFKQVPGMPYTFWGSLLDVIVFYTIGSELFLLLGFALALELTPDAMEACRELAVRMRPVPGREWGLTNRRSSSMGRTSRDPRSAGQAPRRPIGREPMRGDDRATPTW